MTQRHKPRLCIGLPVYNGQNYLSQAIESLLAQSFSDFRLIISDNASTDETEAICRSYGRRDARIAYHRSAHNRGAAWNFNHVCDLADSEYFKWAAHDDLYAPEFAARCIAALDEDPESILCYPTSYVIDERGEIVCAYRDPAEATAATPYERFRAMVWHAGGSHKMFGVIRHDVLRQTQLHGAYPASDRVLLAELALRGKLREVDAPLFFWREHAQRATRISNSDAELAAWFDPANTGRMQFRHWTLFVHYLRTIARVPLPLGQTLRCTALMAQWLLVKFPTIQDEVRGNIAGPVRRALRLPAAPSRPPDSRSRAA